MSNDLISRKSVLDYIENEILKVKGTEALCVLRALSVHIEEYEPTAYDVNKVIEQLEDLVKINMEVLGVRGDYVQLEQVKKIVKRGGIDE